MSQARNWLYRAARLLGDVSAAYALAQGNRRAAQRRAKNKLLGRLMGKVGIWHRLWK